MSRFVRAFSISCTISLCLAFGFSGALQCFAQETSLPLQDGKSSQDTATPAVLTPEDSGNTLPVSLFRGRVTNQHTRYILGPGDKVSITVKDLADFNQEFALRPDGYATIRPFGEMYLAGTDVQGLQAWLEEKFKYYLVKPEISVDIKDMRPALIYVSGAVQRPGTYQFARKALESLTTGSNPTQEKAEITLTNVLAKAGGVSQQADIDHIVVVHGATGEQESFDLRAFMTGEDAMPDLWLLPDDRIIVPETAHAMDPATFRLISKSTYFREKFPVVVLGAVQHQGEVQMDPTDNSLNAALALAGGFMNRISERDSIIVQRPGNNGGFNRWVINRKKSNFELMPGDVVYVSDSKLANTERGLDLLSKVTSSTFFGTNASTAIRSWTVPLTGK